jgi:hypothetical protein
LIEDVQVVDVDGPRGREVALFSRIGPLLVLNPGDQLGDEEVVVRVTLAVRVGGHVDRRPRHEGGQVGTVIDVEAANVILVRLALAAVLADHHAGHRFEDLSRTEHRPLLDLFRGDDTDGTRLREPEQTVHGLVEVGEAAERSPAGHEHVRAERHAKCHLDARGAARWDVHGADGGREAGKAEVHVVPPRREVVGDEPAVGVRADWERQVADDSVHIDADPRKGASALVLDPTLETASMLCVDDRSSRQPAPEEKQQTARPHGHASRRPTRRCEGTHTIPIRFERRPWIRWPADRLP